jgi:hypothetical protein
MEEWSSRTAYDGFGAETGWAGGNYRGMVKVAPSFGTTRP